MEPSFSSGAEALKRPVDKEVCEIIDSDRFLEKEKKVKL
jgi:hypothetical protein